MRSNNYLKSLFSKINEGVKFYDDDISIYSVTPECIANSIAVRMHNALYGNKDSLDSDIYEISNAKDGYSPDSPAYEHPNVEDEKKNKEKKSENNDGINENKNEIKNVIKNVIKNEIKNENQNENKNEDQNEIKNEDHNENQNNEKNEDEKEKDPSKLKVIVDGFCGVGGNTIAFAKYFDKVYAIDNNSEAIECAKNNAEVYNIPSDKIVWYTGDIFDWFKKAKSENLKIDAIFLSPPWGGKSYRDSFIFNLNTEMPIPLINIFFYAKLLTNNISLYLPKNSDLKQLALISPFSNVQIVYYNILGKTKALVAYYDSLILPSRFDKLSSRSIKSLLEENHEKDNPNFTSNNSNSNNNNNDEDEDEDYFEEEELEDFSVENQNNPTKSLLDQVLPDVEYFSDNMSDQD